jgi:hypothetical protein
MFIHHAGTVRSMIGLVGVMSRINITAERDEYVS